MGSAHLSGGTPPPAGTGSSAGLLLEIALVGVCLFGVRALLLLAEIPYAGSGGVVCSVGLISVLQRRRARDSAASGSRDRWASAGPSSRRSRHSSPPSSSGWSCFPPSRPPSILLQGLAFGASHFTQGLAGVVTAGLIGVAFGLVGSYLSPRESLWPVIVGHALPDTISLLG